MTVGPLRPEPLRYAHFEGIRVERCRDRMYVMYELYRVLHRMLPVACCPSYVVPRHMGTR